MARRRAPAIPDELLDQLLAGGDAAAALNSGDLVNALKKALAERALSAAEVASRKMWKLLWATSPVWGR
ncbi:hypothetical protein ACIDI_45c00200 [Acidiphilium sp. JA12-A1]|nr:hypothetical protein ACIDI_45c00200 [Acidiphilium sp. JA12-A1]